MRTHSATELTALREGSLEELARRRFLDFAQRMIPGFQPARHLRLLAEKLEAVERGENQRLLVTLFPGSGKSTLLAAFTAWYLGRNYGRKVIYASLAAELAERNSRFTRDLFRDERWPFHNVELSKDATAMHRWTTTRGGALIAVGVETKFTGWRADLLLLDDLQNDALSPPTRDELWDWYETNLMQRLEPGAAIAWVQQRWSEDDLPGRAMDAQDGALWDVVRLPALAEESDPLGRAPGESLWPERWPQAELERRRARNSRVFECQYQGNPIPGEGDLIKAEWLQRYVAPPAHFRKVVCALDSAAKTGVRNDYSAIVTIGVTENAFYVLDVWRDKVEFPALLRRVESIGEQDEPPSAIYIEDTSNAVALIQQLQLYTTLPVVPVSAKGSKESRVEGITGTLEAKRVFLPTEAPWLVEFERELLGFPGVKHDDMVDAFTLALTQLQAPQYEVYFVEV